MSKHSCDIQTFCNSDLVLSRLFELSKQMTLHYIDVDLPLNGLTSQKDVLFLTRTAKDKIKIPIQIARTSEHTLTAQLLNVHNDNHASIVEAVYPLVGSYLSVYLEPCDLIQQIYKNNEY